MFMTIVPIVLGLGYFALLPTAERLSGNVPVRFAGIVVDQDDNPIPDVTFHCKIAVKSLSRIGAGDVRTRDVRAQSDSHGKVAVGPYGGRHFQFGPKRKDGYDDPRMQVPYLDYIPTFNVAGVEFKYDERHPVQLLMWRVGRRRAFTRTLTEKLKIDDFSVGFDLPCHYATRSPSVGEGNFLIYPVTSPQGTVDAGPWDVRVFSGKEYNSEIAVTPDTRPARAPDRGYVPKMTMTFSADDFKDAAKKTTYFYLRGEARPFPRV